ncbi:restriction endonuclease subunit S [Vibrio cholerae]|uniref:restriction endonuclease subunit S n=1 Tax=Vibrio cholerae TaxID=666 RepID=UPI00227117C3|nr:restriction endonuclease subunit S [Vibrio cholerae]MCX9559288.1 restriction endonuclease subunit S [Vibrio cholerae]MCX9560993.1 restriction endonuclease subunit S [Vibrio cholerae]
MMKQKTYAEYKESGVKWLGQVPGHWNAVSLKWISQRYAGGTPDKSNDAYWDEGEIPWLNSGSVNDGYITEPSAYITREGFANSSAKWIPENALVMALAGQGKTKGMVAQLGIRATCNQSMAAIIPKEKFTPRFLYWWLVSNYQNIRNMAGGEQRDGLNLDMLGSIPCPLLPLPEQTAIADFLDRETGRIDTLLTKKRRLIELLKEKRTALISRIVTRGLPEAETGLEPHTRFKNSGIEWLGQVPEGWDVKKVWIERVSRNIELQDGNHGEQHPKAEDYVGEGIPFVMANHIDNGKIDFNKCNYIEKEQADSLRIGFSNEGDVLLTHKGTIGRVGIVQKSHFPYVMLTPQVTYYRCLREIQNRFLFWLMQSKFWQDQLKLLAGLGSTRAYIGLLDQKTLSFLIPPEKEQFAIAAYLDRETSKLDRLVEKVDAVIARLLEYRTALITAAVTGKIDVRKAVV